MVGYFSGYILVDPKQISVISKSEKKKPSTCYVLPVWPFDNICFSSFGVSPLFCRGEQNFWGPVSCGGGGGAQSVCRWGKGVADFMPKRAKLKMNFNFAYFFFFRI